MASLTTPHTLSSSLTICGEGSSCNRDGAFSGNTSTAVLRQGIVSNETNGEGMLYQISKSIGCSISSVMSCYLNGVYTLYTPFK